MSDLLIALAGGAIGSLITGSLAVGARVATISAEVDRHDRLASALAEDLDRWVWDTHHTLRQELNGITNDMAARGLLQSGAHGGARAEAKTRALRRYRDRLSETERAFAELLAQESRRHDLWRRLRQRPKLKLNEPADASYVVDEWRKDVVRHGRSRARL